MFIWFPLTLNISGLSQPEARAISLPIGAGDSRLDSVTKQLEYCPLMPALFHKPVAEADSVLKASSSRGLRFAIVRILILALSGSVALSAFTGCKNSDNAPLTISFFDPEWSSDQQAPDRARLMESALKDFTAQTGIQVLHLPGPEGTERQLETTRKLMSQGAGGPDVFEIDIVRAGVLADNLVDLSQDFPGLAQSEDPELVNNFRVAGRLVGVPYHTNVGVLYFRTDLLHKYGFQHPPQTWDELEKMSLRIQDGERQAGNKDFWGYVWPGAANESLTCNALEWQVAAGGGRIVGADRTVRVDDPGTVKAWKRAAHWLGWISPPSVIAYREWDVINSIDSEGRSAFARAWTSDYFLSSPHVPEAFDGKLGVTSLPGPAVLGGFGLGVSRSSAHRQAAIRLVSFLLQREQDLEAKRAHDPPPSPVAFYDLPPVLRAYSHLNSASNRGQDFARPSTILGDKYQPVSEAYSEALYSVLTKRQTAELAASRLEKEISKLSGLPRHAKNPRNSN